MTTLVHPSVYRHPHNTISSKGAVGLSFAVGLTAALLVASLAHGQTGQSRRRVSNPPSRSVAASTTTLASYVSDYAGDGQSGMTPRSAPSAQGVSPIPAAAAPHSWSSGTYEQVGPGVPVAAVPGPAMAGGGCDTCGPAGDGCGSDPCWEAGSCYGGDCYPLFSPMRDRAWFRGEYLLWWLDGYSVPPLVTTSTNAADAGILPRPTSQILFGNQNLSGENRSGGRFTLGWWLDRCQNAGLEVTYTMISDDTTLFQSGIISNSILARPFFDSGDGVDSSWLLGQAGQLQGWANVSAKSQFHALEVLLRRPLFQECDHNMDVLVGYRYSALRDELSISDHRMRTGTSPIEPVGMQIDQLDLFKTDNTFHGFQLGFVNEVRYNRWSMELLTKLALGSTRSEITIDGLTTMKQNGTTSVTSGGLLAQATNMGQYQHDNFTVIPELGLTLGYDLTQRLRCTVGYSFIYWSKVVRAGDQIDYDVNLPAVNGQRPTGAQQPEASFKTTDFWAQGLNLGFEYHF